MDVAAEPATVWRTWVDVVGWPTWTPTVSSVERLDDTEFGVGSRVRITQPRMAPAVWEVVDCEPDLSFVWACRVAGTRLVAGHWARPAGEGRCTVELTLDHTGGLAPLLDLFVGGRIRRYVDTEAVGVKRHCEAP